MKKKPYSLLWLLSMLLSTQALFSQATITGKVIACHQEPLSQVSILVFNASDSTLASFATTRQDGSFEMPKLRPGLYYLQYTATGYQKENSDPIRISAGRRFIKMPPQLLIKKIAKVPLVKPSRV